MKPSVGLNMNLSKDYLFSFNLAVHFMIKDILVAC